LSRWATGGGGKVGDRLHSHFPILLQAQPSIVGRYWHCHTMNNLHQMFNDIGSGIRLQLSLENIVSADLTVFSVSEKCK